MIDNSIPMMADLYKSAGVSSLQGLEASVKANFNEAQVCKNLIPKDSFSTHGRFAMPGRSFLMWKLLGMISWPKLTSFHPHYRHH